MYRQRKPIHLEGIIAYHFFPADLAWNNSGLSQNWIIKTVVDHHLAHWMAYLRDILGHKLVVNLVVDLREPHHTSNLEEYLLQDCCGKLSLSSRVAICGRSVPCAQGLMYEDSNVGCNMLKIIAHQCTPWFLWIDVTDVAALQSTRSWFLADTCFWLRILHHIFLLYIVYIYVMHNHIYILYTLHYTRVTRQLWYMELLHWYTL